MLSFHDNVGYASEKQVNLFFTRLARHFSYGVSALSGAKARALKPLGRRQEKLGDIFVYVLLFS